jgi:hypothetical protein
MGLSEFGASCGLLKSRTGAFASEKEHYNAVMIYYTHFMELH